MKLSAEEMLSKYSANKSHAVEVRRLAMMIFDEVSMKLHALSNKQRSYLEAAALLHDIGYAIESDDHNIHSMEIVIENGIEGFNDHDAEIIGCICRYHRGSLPKKNKHDVYKSFDKKDRKTVKRLGGILKLSDGFDRAHLSLIKKIKIEYDKENNIVEFLITPNIQEYRPDISYAVRKRDLFEVGFKCQSVLKFSE